MSARIVAWVGFTAGALSACGGRAAVSENGSAMGGCPFDCEQPEPGAGSTASARGGSSGAAGAAYSAGGPDGAGGTGNVSGAPTSAGAGGACDSGSWFASEALSHSFGGGQSFNQAAGFPKAIFGPPAAGDTSSVVSLGNGGWVVLGFSGNVIVDGPGVDFTVFENPLLAFKELATIAVSNDAIHWTEFPCTAAQDASDYGLCAGVGVVYSSPNNGIDPLDPAVSGGDHYDLADIGLKHARYVRVTDRADLEGSAGVFDLDAVAIVHSECPPNIK